MGSTYVGYIDESGDDGFLFGGGSSDWFVVSAVITRKATDLDAVRLVDTVRARLGRPPKKALHFRDLRHEQRLLYVDAIARASLRTAAVLVHKPSLLEPEKFRERNRLYFHAIRYLLERVSWYCRDHRTSTDDGDGSLDLVFSSRSSMSHQELSRYLAHLKAFTGPLDIHIDWNVIKAAQVSSVSPGRLMGLQIADAVAGAFFYALEPSQYGFSEDRYARILKAVVYRHEGTYLGHGLKLWPREAGQLLGEERYRWIADHYR